MSHSLNIHGHKLVKSTLQQVNAHTLLFVGPERVGRRQIARWYTAWLNCQEASEDPCGRCSSCEALLANYHPDYREVAPDHTTASGKTNKRPEIKISQLVPRKDSHDLALSQWLESRPRYKWRVAVIDSAHSLTVSAANAFLKTLEEPPAQCKIILIAPSPDSVLATIRSRSSILRFAPDRALSEQTYPLAPLGRYGDQSHREDNESLLSFIEPYVTSLNQTLEEAFEAADALQKQWEQYPDAAILLLAQFRTRSPAAYAFANEAIESFNQALSAYASAPVAMQVLTLELRKAMRL